MERIMFEHLSASTRILLVSGAGVALAAALATSQPFFDKVDVASSGAAPVERAPAEPASVAGPQEVAKIAEQVKPAAIAVISHIVANAVVAPQMPGMQKNPYRFGTSEGSGFFITADGYAVTNDHVVNGSAAAEIRLDDGKTYKARVVASDPTSDLALLKIDGRNDFPHVKFADKAPDVGDRIISVGNPFGLGGTVTAGIVSARGRDVSKFTASKATYEDLIQIDAPINKGNSGGPTFDLVGNVIGVNSIIYSPTGGSIGIGDRRGSIPERAGMPRPWQDRSGRTKRDRVLNLLKGISIGLRSGDQIAKGRSPAAGGLRRPRLTGSPECYLPGLLALQ
jgi:S1-C subfamily serine protease